MSRNKLRFGILLIVQCLLTTGLISSTNQNCDPEPPPDWFTTGVITPTSVQLQWGYNSGNIPNFTKIEIFDLTDQVSLPSVILPGSLGYVYSGLTPGHQYSAKVSCSTCEAGPFGQRITIYFTTVVIIVDQTVQNSCNQLGSNEGVYGVETYTLEIASPNESVEVQRTRVEDYSGQNYTEFILWAQCDNKLHLFQVDNNGFTRNPPLNNGVYSVPTIDYLINGVIQFSIAQPEVINDLMICRIEYNVPLMRAQCSGYTGNYIPCPEIGEGGENGGGSHGRSAPVEKTRNPNPFPNPFTNQLQIAYQLESHEPISIQMRNMTGQIVKEWNSNGKMAPGEHQLSLNTSDLPSGPYYINILKGNKQEQHLVIKQE